MADARRWKDECRAYGWRIVRASGNNPDHYPYVHSDGRYKYLSIYSASGGDRLLTIQAPTYYDLMRAAQAAWNTHTFIQRGF